ncbi:MAG TPA: helix-turn-helix domain-containing protein [Patescibacteria group bacterium]|nr:helix-turn-helix domain-containing protein [Patescibacteria group bacterium]
MQQASFEVYQKLIQIGFGKKEALVYLATLELGDGKVSEIARRAGINRTTAYDILDGLVTKGLIAVSGKEPKQEYVAKPPTSLKGYLQSEIELLKGRAIEALNLIPQLSSIHNVRGRPKVMFYEGKEGLMQVYEDTLTSHETIRAYASVEDMHAALPEYFPKYFFRRADKGIKIRAIFPSTPDAKLLESQNKAHLRETAVLTDKNFTLSTEMNIYDHKVMIVSWREKLGIIIESAEIAEDMKQIFELAWKEAKRQEQDKSKTGTI